MKKALFSVVVLVLLWNCGTVFTQEEGKGRGTDEQDKQKRRAQEIGRGWQSDANELRSRVEAGRERIRGRKREQRQMRREELLRIREMGRRERAGQDVNQPSGKLGKDKDYQQRLKALQTQMAHEEAKHLRRIARLKRIRELAVGEASTIGRVDKLMQKEQLRYDRKQQHMRVRMRMLTHMQERGPKALRPGERRASERSRTDVGRQTYRRRGGGKSKEEDASGKAEQ